MKIFLTIILGIALAIMGEVLAFRVYASYSQGGFINGFWGITAFITIVLGILLLIYHPVAYADKIWADLKEKSKFIQFIAGSIVFIFLVSPFVIAIIAFYHFTGKYHDTQLEQFGTIRAVVIEYEIEGGHSRHDLCFRFLHNGKIWEGMLDAWQYKVGDTTEIIYSSQNPNETEWYKKYVEEKHADGKDLP